MKTRVHFSFIDIVIIAAVLTVIAVNTVPRYTQAKTQTRVSILMDGLQLMRCKLDLYQVRNNGYLPPCDSFACFEAAMTIPTGRYNFYVKQIPVNPFNQLNTVRFDGEPAGADLAGWRLDTKTGLFQADNDPVFANL